MTRSTTDLGRKGEEFACQRLTERGMRIIDRNIREKFAEIDIVAEDRDTLCFVEVRTREDTCFGHPAETITPQKKRVIRRAAEMYLIRHNISGRPIRFDVATIVWNTGEFLYFADAF